ncbi:MAG TPA: Ig-like domain-containing protein [Clostridia bacterium]|nr:Ig-like domain-containing protein [Clostridia bacterium]
MTYGNYCRRYLTAILTVIFFFVLLCDPVSAVPDTAPPVLTSFAPTDGTTGLAVNIGNLSLVFNEPVWGQDNKKLSIYEASKDYNICNLYTGGIRTNASNTAVLTFPAGFRLRYGSAYYVKIDQGAFKDAAGNDFSGIDSCTAWVFITAPDNIPPTDPGNLRLVSKTDTSVSLEWDPSTDNDRLHSYIIYKDSGNGFEFADSSTTNSCTLTELNPNTAYVFRVNTIDSSINYSPGYSNELRVTTNAAGTASDGQAETGAEAEGHGAGSGSGTEAADTAAGNQALADLEAPKDVSVEVRRYEDGRPYFAVTWTNPQSVLDLVRYWDERGEAPLEYQIDIKVGNGQWRYDMGETIYGNSLHAGDDETGVFAVNNAPYDPVNMGQLNTVNTTANSYQFRVRYSYLFSDGSGEYYKYSPFSDTASAGLQAADAATDTGASNQQQGDGRWNGVWKIDMGMLTLAQSGNDVSGAFGEWEDNYQLNGIAEGNKLAGTIDYYGEPGSFEFVVSPDGRIDGWCRPDGYEDWEDSIEWMGVKVSDSFGNTGTGWGGTWYTDFGPMVLTQNGSSITGVYRVYTDTPVFQLEGTVSGNVFTGRVREGEFTGEFEFSLESDAKSFTGKYHYTGEDEWTDWNGTRKK